MIGFLLSALPTPTALGAGTTIAVDVVGPLAQIAIERRFVHAGSDPIDAKLAIPVPAGGGIGAVSVAIGDRRIASRVEVASAALTAYRDAAEAGQRAVLAEAVADDVVVQHIANVMPGDEVEVRVELSQPVARDGGAWRLVLPLTLAPRFDDDLDLIHAIGPDVASRAPPWVERAVRAEDRADVSVSVEAGSPLRWIESASHPFHARIDTSRGLLRVDGAAMDRDLQVQWATALPDPAASLIVADGYGLLTVEAPAPWARVAPPPLDLVVLIDASDSMVGRRSARLGEIVEALLARLRSDDRVTVLRFADTVRGLAVRASPQQAAAIPARLRTAPIGGGSAFADGLRAAVSVPAPPDRPVVVVAITDGCVGWGAGEAERIDAVLQARPNVVVHTVALGASPNHGLLDGIARATGGIALALRQGESVDGALAALREGFGGPVLTDVRVGWGDHPVRDEPVVPPLYADRAVAVSVRGVGCEGPVEVQGRLSGRPYATVVHPRCVDDPRALAVLWARQQLANPELPLAMAQAIAVEHQVLGPGTRFVGVDARVANPGGRTVAWRSALALPFDEPAKVLASAKSAPPGCSDAPSTRGRARRGLSSCLQISTGPIPSGSSNVAGGVLEGQRPSSGRSPGIGSALAAERRLESIERMKGLLSRGVAHDTKADLMMRLADLHFEHGAALHEEGSEAAALWLGRAIRLYRGFVRSYPHHAHITLVMTRLAAALSWTGRSAEAAEVLETLASRSSAAD